MWERDVRWRRVVVLREVTDAREAEAVRWVRGLSGVG